MINANIAQLQRARRRELRLINKTTAGSVTVGTPLMSRRERIGGVVDQMQTYSISGGSVSQSGYSTYATSQFDTTTFGS